MSKIYKRRFRKKNIVKRRVIIISTVFFLSLIFAIGYAAFNTTINLNVKGNIYKESDKCYKTTDNGDDTVSIIDYDKNCGSVVNIPQTIKGKTVTKISDASSNINAATNSFCNKNLTSVTIPNTIKYIGEFAFYSNKITSVNLGNGVEEIKDEAFHGNQLTSITFPDSLKKIGHGAFIDNYLKSIPSLKNINYGQGAFTFNNMEPENAFIYEQNSDGSTDYTALNSYATRKWIDTITIPNTVKYLKYYSLRFANARAVTLNDGIEEIAGFTTMQANFVEINIPSTIKKINPYAFVQTPNLKTININKPENSVKGAPWGATNATINWLK